MRLVCSLGGDSSGNIPKAKPGAYAYDHPFGVRSH